MCAYHISPYVVCIKLDEKEIFNFTKEGNYGICYTTQMNLEDIMLQVTKYKYYRIPLKEETRVDKFRDRRRMRVFNGY